MLTPRNAHRPNRLSSCVRLRLRVDIHREDAAIVNRQSVAAAVAAVFLAAVAASAQLDWFCTVLSSSPSTSVICTGHLRLGS